MAKRRTTSISEGERLKDSASENARLLAARDREVIEILDQQTATGEILRAIASSPTDVNSVLAAVAKSAARLGRAYDAVILLRDGDSLVLGAHHGPIPIDFTTWPLTRMWTAGRAVLDGEPVHVHDLASEADEFPDGQAMALRLGHRTILSIPLLRERESIGCLTVRRTEVRPFSERQVAMLQTFADQAVIAIENARLFEEVQERNRELAEALEQQVATSAILRTIAASPTNIQPVLITVA
jgi:GAF domain-containing protein